MLKIISIIFLSLFLFSCNSEYKNNENNFYQSGNIENNFSKNKKSLEEIRDEIIEALEILPNYKEINYKKEKDGYDIYFLNNNIELINGISIKENIIYIYFFSENISDLKTMNLLNQIPYNFSKNIIAYGKPILEYSYFFNNFTQFEFSKILIKMEFEFLKLKFPTEYEELIKKEINIFSIKENINYEKIKNDIIETLKKYDNSVNVEIEDNFFYTFDFNKGLVILDTNTNIINILIYKGELNIKNEEDESKALSYINKLNINYTCKNYILPEQVHMCSYSFFIGDDFKNIFNRILYNIIE